MLLIASQASAQTPAPQRTLPAVEVRSGGAAVPPDVGGFGDVPAAELPLSVQVLPAAKLQAAGVRTLADITRMDASTSDAYNSAGYWDFLSVRGFTLDNRYNYRREGLPISAETSIALDNKERIELLKGTSGIQAGTSAPGGLVNYVVKRPTNRPLRAARLETGERGSLLGAVDLGGRFGEADRFGYRLNLAHENLRPLLRNADGSRSLASLAMDWRLGPDTVIDAEVEWSRRSQPSQPGFSLLGATLPAPVDPRTNLNNQPWSQPVVFGGVTGSVRLEQALGSQWRWTAQAGTQRLQTDDRVAFPFGPNYAADHTSYAPNGDYDLYDYRSEGERRTLGALRLAVHGKVDTGSLRHDIGFGVLRSTTRERYNRQAFNYVGTGNVGTQTPFPADPSLTGENTNRDEETTELFAHDQVRWQAWRFWVGGRHTKLQRSSVRTDGTQPVAYQQSLTTPWLAVSRAIGPALVYASAGKGVESRVVPNLPAYGAAAGQPLPALQSRQLELGVRGGDEAFNWGLAWFNIVRPAVTDTGATVQFDGDARHRGLEAQAQSLAGPWRLEASAMLLDAQRRGSTLNPLVNGLKPVNVPSHTLRATAAYRVPSLPGLEVETRLVARRHSAPCCPTGQRHAAGLDTAGHRVGQLPDEARWAPPRRWTAGHRQPHRPALLARVTLTSSATCTSTPGLARTVRLSLHVAL
jgi:iron complex outermembrane receptor protein